MSEIELMITPPERITLTGDIEAGIFVTVSYVRIGDDGPQGPAGDTGPEGKHITAAEFTGDDMVFTFDDSTTISLVDAKVTLKGEQGIQGLIGQVGPEGKHITAAEFSGDDMDFSRSRISSVYITSGSRYL